MILKLDEMQRDVLREIANIGAGNASTLLSNTTGRIVKLTVSALDVVSLKHVSTFVEASKGLIIAVYASIRGGILGNVMLILPKESAFSLADVLQRKKMGTTKWLSVGVQRELKRFSRSLLKCYLDAITEFLNIKTGLGETRLVATFGETVVDFVLLSIRQEPEHMILLKTELSVEPNVKGEFSLFLPMKSVELLLSQPPVPSDVN